MKKLLCVFVAAALILLSGCSASTNNEKDKKIVAASFYPVYIFALNLLEGVDDVQVECMAEQAVGCLHDYTLTAGDAKLLDDAQVLLINGAGMESFLDDVYESTKNLCVVDSSEGIELLCEGDEHSHTHTQDAVHSHNHIDNSHIWLSVANAKKQVENLKNGLCAAFPEYEREILDNYTGYVKRLDALEKDMNACSAKLKCTEVVTFHAAYDYMGQEMGFHIIDTIESDEGGEPSAKELAHLSEEIKEHKVKVLFTEPEYDGSAAEILSNETGAQICVLNPVLKGEKSLTAYEDIMRSNYIIMCSI